MYTKHKTNCCLIKLYKLFFYLHFSDLDKKIHNSNTRLIKTTKNHKKLYNNLQRLKSLLNTSQNNINKLNNTDKIFLYDDAQTDKVKY